MSNKRTPIIFLDFDGVINGNNLIYGILMKIGSQKIFHFVEDHILGQKIYGVHKKKVKLLAKICKKTGARVVFTSSWGEGVYQAYKEYPNYEKYYNDNERYLAELLHKYEIEVIDCAKPVDNIPMYKDNRQNRIIQWLAHNYEKVNGFIILDDEYSHLYKMKMFCIFTTNNINEVKRSFYCSDNIDIKKIKGTWSCFEGLNRKYTKKAIDLLNNNMYKGLCITNIQRYVETEQRRGHIKID